jgi:hypothetical protein
MKLMLLHIRGDINIDSTLVTNINPASPLRGMTVVLNQPRAVHAHQFADLMRMTVDLAKEQVYTNIHSLQVLIRVMSKVLASHMLQGNFATEKVTSLELETNSIKPSDFLPQKNAWHIEHEKNNEVKATLENVMEFSGSNKTKGNTAISCIGTMIPMTNFSSLCIKGFTAI